MKVFGRQEEWKSVIPVGAYRLDNKPLQSTQPFLNGPEYRENPVDHSIAIGGVDIITHEEATDGFNV